MSALWLPLVVIVMEAVWMQALAAALAPWVVLGRPGHAAPVPGLLVVCVVLLVGYVAGRRLLVGASGSDAPVARWRAALCLVLGGMVALLVAGSGARGSLGVVPWLAGLPAQLSESVNGLTPDVAVLALVLGLWWRGLHLGTHPPAQASTVRSFGLGALALAIALLLHPQPLALTGHVLLYLAAGLPALSLAAVLHIREDLEAGAAYGHAAQLDSTWWRSLLPALLAVLGVALVVAVILGDTGWNSLLRGWLSAAGNGLLAVLYWPLLATGYVAAWLIDWLEQFTAHAPPSAEALQAPTGLDTLLRQSQDTPTNPAIGGVLRWVALVVLVLLLLLAYAGTTRAVRRRRPAGASSVSGRESLWSWHQFRRDLATWLSTLLRRLRPSQSPAAATRSADSSLAGSPSPGIASSRAAYRHLLYLGRANALPRRPHQTADEYLAAWRETLPATPEAAQLTHDYTRARYGPPSASANSPSPTTLQALLHVIEQALRRQSPL